MTDQLEVLFPTGKELTIAGETFNITPFKAGQLPKVFKAVEPISGHIVAAFAAHTNPTSAIIGLLASGGENILDIAAIGARKPRAWVDELETDQLLELVAAVLEVNVSFFVQKVLPSLTNSISKVSEVTGQTLS